MLKIVVAEDEKLVRKGIVGIIDWKKYNVEIVGEVESGKAALEFLKKNEVDLLLTDLTMPGICGLEYIEKVRIQFPKVHIVILTMHRDFNMIQKAMRLGIVDYITKDQIEENDFEKNLVSILERVSVKKIEEKRNATQGVVWGERKALVVCALGENEVGELLKEDLLKESVYLDQGKCILPLSVEIEKKIEDISLLVYGIKIYNLKGKEYKEIKKQVNQFIAQDLFYIYEPQRSIYELESKREGMIENSNWEEVLNYFEVSKWVRDDKIYQQSLEELIRLQLTREELTVFGYQLYIEWSQYTGVELRNYFEKVSSIEWWYQWRKWFEDNREILRCKLYSDSSELQNKVSIQKALRYIEQNYQSNLSLEEVLKVVGMSKSHFSKLFKEETGKTFINYLNDYRIEQAKRLLKETDFTNMWIAEQVGFGNERYFRRVFIDKVGIKPTEFRKCSK